MSSVLPSASTLPIHRCVLAIAMLAPACATDPGDSQAVDMDQPRSPTAEPRQDEMDDPGPDNTPGEPTELDPPDEPGNQNPEPMPDMPDTPDEPGNQNPNPPPDNDPPPPVGEQDPACRFGLTLGGNGSANGFKTLPLDIGPHHYNIQTNPWGGATQTISVGNGKVFNVDSMIPPGGKKEWEVVSYPSVYRGTANGGHPTRDSGMPIAVSQIKSVPTGMSTNALSNPYAGNTTYDVYFTRDRNYTGGTPDHFLMVWFHSHKLNPVNDGEGWSCANQAPVNIDSCTDHQPVVINGKKFHRFIGPNRGAFMISYVPETPFEKWQFDLKEFIDDAVDQGVFTKDVYLQSIQGGFEMTTSGTGLRMRDFYACVQ